MGYPMSTEPINYEAVIADLEAKKEQLETTINMLRALSGLGTLGITPSPSGGGVSGGGKIASDAFFGKSIPEAAAIHLGNVRKKLSTQALMEAMEAGGLPKSKYNTVYAILRRRESQVGDLINMQGEWGLAAWYPNHTKKAKKDVVSASASASTDESAEVEEIDDIFADPDEKATA
jgi:hypothetical protein